MSTGAGTGFGVFSDALVQGFSRITLSRNSHPLNRRLIFSIGDIIVKVRSHPKPRRLLLNSMDPVLEAIFDFLNREGVHFRWEKVVILGCSAGGEVALRTLFKYILVPHLPILVAMHHMPNFRFMTQFEMANNVSQRIDAAKDGEQIRGSRIYFLPGESETGFSATTTSFAIRPLNYRPRFRPEIDKIFATTGVRFKSNSMGVVLSGMLNDGAEGAKAMTLSGGDIWVQEPSSALFPDMPNSAIRAVPGARVKSLPQIADRINHLSENHMVLEPIGGKFS